MTCISYRQAFRACRQSRQTNTVLRNCLSCFAPRPAFQGGHGIWRENTPYRSDEDWIFASPHYHGKTPYTYQILFRRHIRPVIERVAGIKSSKEAPIGWHTLRRSLATLLISNGENVKVAQSQLRHTNPKITLVRTGRFSRSAGRAQEGCSDGASCSIPGEIEGADGYRNSVETRAGLALGVLSVCRRVCRNFVRYTLVSETSAPTL